MSDIDRAALVGTIKQWMALESAIAASRRDIKAIVAQKKELTTHLVALMKSGRIDEIDLSDGKIIRKTKKNESANQQETFTWMFK